MLWQHPENAQQDQVKKQTVPHCREVSLNKNRYWWKVQLPGEPSPKARPLKPNGSRFATTDYSTAIEVAKGILEKHLFETCQKNQEEILNIASLVRA